MTQAKNIVAVYFVNQAVIVAAWWLMLWYSPQMAQWFLPRGFPTESLTIFWLADVVMLVAGSWVAAFGARHQKAWAATAVWSVATVSWYPTLCCLATSVLRDEAWIATTMMVCMATASLAMASIYGHGRHAPEAIRVIPMTRLNAVIGTVVQIVVFWSAFLWVFPRGIDEFCRLLGGYPFQHRGQALGATIVFGVASALGLWSALSIAIHGCGTPLPTATAPKLVVTGPYRFVRNPMALAGITQGIAVGWYLGSPAVIGYALCGALAWQFGARPVEERDLVRRFGLNYVTYRSQVPLWLPKLNKGIMGTS